jgi:two-component system, LytTR family, response regulator
LADNNRSGKCKIMELIRAYLIDDEEPGLKNLELQLTRFCGGLVEIVGSSTNPLKARAEVEQLRPDVLFLDINMPQLNGIDFVSTFSNHSFDVIFVTAFEQYAISAIKLGATDYLLKPVLVEDLKEALLKVNKRNKSNDSKQDILESKIQLLHNEKYVLTPIQEIILISGDDNYSKVFTMNHGCITMSKTLKEYEDKLTHHSFFRVHKSALINLNQIKEYSFNDGGFVVMNNEMTIPIARRKHQDFKVILTKYTR